MAIAYQYDPSLLEPAFPQRTRRLEDLAVELVDQSGALIRGLHRSVLKRLLGKGLLVADSPKREVRLGFPVVAAEQWLPRLWSLELS
jgi:hypothetical protein